MKKYWDRYTDKYGRTIFHPQFIINSLTHKAIGAIKKYAINKKLLDIGCGRATYKKELLSVVSSYTGVDHPQISKLYISDTKPDILASVEKLPLKDDSYDVISMLQVLEYLPDQQKALNEATRVLKKGGYLIITSPFMYPLHDGKYDRVRLSKSQIKYLLIKTGLIPVRLSQQGQFFDFWAQSLLVYYLKLSNTLLKKRMIEKIIGATILFLTLSLTPFINLAVLLFRNFNQSESIFPLNILAIAKKL